MKPLMSSTVFARHTWSRRFQALGPSREAKTATAQRGTCSNASAHWLKHLAACAALPGHPERLCACCLRVTQQGTPTCAA